MAANKKPKKQKKEPPNTTVVISGDVRRGAALVEGVAIGLTKRDGALRGSGTVAVDGDRVTVSVQVRGEPGAAFEVATKIDGLGTAKVEDRLDPGSDALATSWDIPKGDFKDGDDA